MFVVLQLDAGGSERVVLDLATGLDQNLFEVYIAAFKGGVLEDDLRKKCKDIFFIQKKKGLDITAMYQVAKIVRDYRIDIVNAHHYMPCFYCFLATKILNQRRLIYTEHSVPEVDGIVSSFHGQILCWMLFRMNAVIGVSREITDKFKKHYPRHAEKFYAILNGVDMAKFRVKSNRDDVRKRWGLSKDHFVVGTVANFKKVKNHACLVRAAENLKDSYPHLRFLFVGTGFPGDPYNSEGEVRDLIRKFGLKERIILTGYQENIPDMLPAFDAFCLPSISEGMPVSLLEAMAAGVVVIGSRVRGIREVVTHRETGLLFSPNNDSDLASLIEEILKSQCFARELTDRALSYVKEIHNTDMWLKYTSNILLYS